MTAPTLHTPDDLARMFDVTPEKVLEWRRRFDWPHVRVGRRVRFTDAQVREIIDRHTRVIERIEDSPQVRVHGVTPRSAKHLAKRAAS